VRIPSGTQGRVGPSLAASPLLEVLAGQRRWHLAAGDCRALLPLLPECSVHCVVTSPPYWNLRDDGHAGQLGREPTPDLYVANLVDVFRQVRRVLRDDGTAWLVLGSCFMKSAFALWGLKPLDEAGLPSRVYQALQADGWLGRGEVIWHKTNAQPENVVGSRWERHRVRAGGKGPLRDCPGCARCREHGGLVFRHGSGRPTKAHEYVLLLAKTGRYYYDMVASQEPSVADHPSGSRGRRGNHQRGRSHFGTNAPWDGVGGARNRRSVWSASVKAPRGAHHATFPPDLVEPCVRASTSEKGACPRCGAPWARVVMASGARTNGHAEGLWKPTCACPPATPVPCLVLDPFAGTGSALVDALGLGRFALGCELNKAFAHFGEQRVRRVAGDEKDAD
jgi:DNA modification methylase